jgi:hypothetical protein
MSAPAVDVEIVTDTGPSKDPLLGRMVGTAALTMNVLDVVTSLSSRLGVLATALRMILVDVSRMAPL